MGAFPALRARIPMLHAALPRRAAGLALLALAWSACTAPGATPADKRATVDEMAEGVLARLYREEPGTRTEVRDAVGYAVFSNVGVGIFLVSGGGGFGVAVDQRKDERTYMRMAEAGVGIGLAVKDFRAVFVFDDGDAFEDFVADGWDLGGEADLVAKAGEDGVEFSEAATVRPGVRVYQLTESGLALRANLTGTKYWPYQALN